MAEKRSRSNAKRYRRRESWMSTSSPADMVRIPCLPVTVMALLKVRQMACSCRGPVKTYHVALPLRVRVSLTHRISLSPCRAHPYACAATAVGAGVAVFIVAPRIASPAHHFCPPRPLSTPLVLLNMRPTSRTASRPTYVRGRENAALRAQRKGEPSFLSPDRSPPEVPAAYRRERVCVSECVRGARGLAKTGRRGCPSWPSIGNGIFRTDEKNVLAEPLLPYASSLPSQADIGDASAR